MKKRIFSVMIAVLMALLLLPTAFADMGPKDQLTIYVENPPDETYYLDLLYETDNNSPYNNLSNDDTVYDETMLAALSAYDSDGWYPAYAYGTDAPMWGSLIGKADGARMVHTFSYFGVPETYKIIIVTESGSVSVSDAYTRPALQSAVTLDYATGKVSQPSVAIEYILQFLSSCIPTLLIEGILFLLFGFYKKRKNIKVFFAVNILTQLAMTAVLGTMLIQYGPVSVIFSMLPVEVCITAAETIVYAWLFEGYRKRRSVVYAIVANIASCAVGFTMIYQQFDFITGFMLPK